MRGARDTVEVSADASIALPASAAVTRAYLRAVLIFLTTGFLWCSAAAVVLIAEERRTPDSDTGERASRSSLAWSIAIAIGLLVVSGPVAFAIGRKRWLLAMPLVGLGVAAFGFGAATLSD